MQNWTMAVKIVVWIYALWRAATIPPATVMWTKYYLTGNSGTDAFTHPK